MTREEEILNKAIAYSETEENFLEYDDCGYVSDDKEFIEQAFTEGAKWASKTMIDKACEIAKDILSSYSFAHYPHEMQDFLVDFRKAMEE